MDCVRVMVEHRLDQRKVDVDMLNTVKHVLAGISTVSPSSEQLLVFETSLNTFITAQVQHIHMKISLIQSILFVLGLLSFQIGWDPFTVTIETIANRSVIKSDDQKRISILLVTSGISI